MLRVLFLAVCFASFWALAANADERILEFDSRVSIQPDGSYLVTETIKVRAEGKKIRRGIFRDFPLIFSDAGRERRVGFELLSATRNGKAENTRIERASRALRIYLGKADYTLPKGIYTYQMQYRTDRQLRRFKDGVEVYWNATGNFWDFPIDRATATIDLPDGATAKATTFFTGAAGATGKSAAARTFENGNVVRVSITRPLGRNQGLTVAVSFDKQFVSAPTDADRARWFVKDFAAEIFLYGGAIFAFLYYLVTWNHVGRDPPGGVMVPRWDLPEGVSPALVNFIDNRGLKGKGFDAISSATLNLAVKGHVELENIGGTVVITARSPGLPGDLPTGERAVLKRVLAHDGQLQINSSNGKRVKELADKFSSAMESEHRSVYYRSNLWHFVPGLLISVLSAVLAIIFSQGQIQSILPLIPVLIAVAVVTSVMFAKVRNFGSGGLPAKIKAVLGSALMLIILVNAGASASIVFPDFIEQPWLIGGTITLLLINILFFFLLGAPTPLGRKRMDEIAGLKHYLTVAEADRMNMQGAPRMSPAHYETLLPYAVALGVEKPWSQAFQSWLAVAVAAGAAAAAGYHGPSWYNGGRGFGGNSIGDTMSNIGSDIASSLTSSMPAPESSSSGFSGGSSGGGGGGW